MGLLKIIKTRFKKNTIELIRKKGGIVGENVHIWSTKIDLKWAFLLEIGNNVTISDARILLHDGSSASFCDGFSFASKIVIGDNVFIGADSIILPGKKIGNNVIIGAGTIVSKDIPNNTVVVGNPQKIICSYEDFKKKRLLKYNSCKKINKGVEDLTHDDILNIKKQADLNKGTFVL